jgi:hypothetical protein
MEFTFKINKFGWINCDVFIEDKGERVVAKIEESNSKRSDTFQKCHS